MHLSILFEALTTHFHLDAASEEVDRLAADFVARCSSAFHESGSASCWLTVVRPEGLGRYEGVHHLLLTYGFGLAKQARLRGDAYLVGVRLLPPPSHLDSAFRGHVTATRPTAEVLA